jgi:hypothetical protein
MQRIPSASWWSAGLFLTLALTASAAEPAAADGDARMRAALRESTLQLRTAQADLASAQAAQATLAAEKKDLTEKYEGLRKQVIADRATAEKAVGGLAAQVTDLKAQLAKFSAALEAAKATGAQAAQAGRVSEEQRAKLAGEVADLQQKLADREAKNLALFMLGNQILNRYEEFSLGNALRAKEPFVGSTRTKLENLVQDLQDKLDDQRVKN